MSDTYKIFNEWEGLIMISKLVTCMGELLIDMIQVDEGKLFEAHPGGAPANVAVGVSRLGGKSAFMGRVGNDSFGDFLEDTLRQDGVNTRGLKRGGKTGMALVTLGGNGERSFEFYGELTTYNEMDVDLEVLDESCIFHFGSILLIKKPESLATIKCLKYAKEKGLLVSYDPNIRHHLWSSANSAREGVRTGLIFADVLKVSDEELKFLTEEQYIDTGISKLIEMAPNLKLIAVTLGVDGSHCYYKGQSKSIPTMRVNAVDTTGAGDGFAAGLLYSIAKAGGLENMDWNKVEQAVKLANAVGSITTTNKGAITALPTMQEVENYKLDA